MKEYLEQVLHLQIEEQPFQNKALLPLGLRNTFELSELVVLEQKFLLAAPVEDMNLAELRKARAQLERHSGSPCVLYLKTINWYAVSKMVEEGIPFVWEGHQVYLPFLGMLLKDNVRTGPAACSEISFLTQKLLLKALYEGWQDVTAARASELLGVTRMSGTRCFDEIEALSIPFLEFKGRSRRLSAVGERKALWEILRPYLRTPVIRTLRLETDPGQELVLSGISALAAYSMLGDDPCPAYAVQKGQMKALGLTGAKKVPAAGEPACIVHEVGYILPFGDGKAVDPLSLTLILTETELAEARVESSVNEMLEELVW